VLGTGRGSRPTRSSGRPASAEPCPARVVAAAGREGPRRGGRAASGRGHEHVWALGDCALVPNTRSDRPDPPTCQHALRRRAGSRRT
jgi:hypothetical protein